MADQESIKDQIFVLEARIEAIQSLYNRQRFVTMDEAEALFTAKEYFDRQIEALQEQLGAD